MIITIDGPSGSGTTTQAKRLARQLGWPSHSAGNHLRTIAWAAILAGLFNGRMPSEEEILFLIRQVVIEPDISCGFRLNGQDVGNEIHSAAATAAVQVVAAMPEVRAWHDEEMRRFAATHRNVVFEGRRTGHVFTYPAAAINIWLDVEDATAYMRVSNDRGSEVAELGAERLVRDRTRTVAPAVPVQGAVHIDANRPKDRVAADINVAVEAALRAVAATSPNSGH